MTKEEKLEKLENLKTLNTQAEGQYSRGRIALINVEGAIRTLRRYLDSYERVLRQQRD